MLAAELCTLSKEHRACLSLDGSDRYVDACF